MYEEIFIKLWKDNSYKSLLLAEKNVTHAIFALFLSGLSS